MNEEDQKVWDITDKILNLENRNRALEEALLWCQEFLEARDTMNAKMNCAPVRSSSLTMRVNQALEFNKVSKP